MLVRRRRRQCERYHSICSCGCCCCCWPGKTDICAPFILSRNCFYSFWFVCFAFACFRQGLLLLFSLPLLLLLSAFSTPSATAAAVGSASKCFFYLCAVTEIELGITCYGSCLQVPPPSTPCCNQSSLFLSVSLCISLRLSLSCSFLFSVCFCAHLSFWSVENCLFYLVKACSLASLAIFDTQVIDCTREKVARCVFLICSIDCCKWNFQFQSTIFKNF